MQGWKQPSIGAKTKAMVEPPSKVVALLIFLFFDVAAANILQGVDFSTEGLFAVQSAPEPQPRAPPQPSAPRRLAVAWVQSQRPFHNLSHKVHARTLKRRLLDDYLLHEMVTTPPA